MQPRSIHTENRIEDRTDRIKTAQLLTRGEIALVIALVLPIFLLFGGPIWEHPFRLDAAIGWSYAPIPLLVAALLLKRKALSVGGFLVSTIIAVSVKYLVTTTVAVAFWMTGEQPPREISVLGPPVHGPRRVVDERIPILELAQDAGGFLPPVVIVRKDQPLALRSRDGSLHTMRGRARDGTIVFNHPAVSTSSPKPFSIGRTGTIEISCTVHEREDRGTLVVID
jgi:hypothetical protein